MFLVARAIFQQSPLQQETEEAVVLRERRRVIRVRARLLPADQNTNLRCACLWHRRSLDSLPHYQDNRSSSATNRRNRLERGFRRGSDRMASEEGCIAFSTITHRSCKCADIASGREPSQHINATEEVYIDQRSPVGLDEGRTNYQTKYSQRSNL